MSTGYENGLDLEGTLISMLFANPQLVKELFVDERVFLDTQNRKVVRFIKKVYQMKQTLDIDLLLSLLPTDKQQNDFLDYYSSHTILFANFSMFYSYQERLEEIYLEHQLKELAEKYKENKITSDTFVSSIRELEKENLLVKSDNRNKLTPEEMIDLIRKKDKLITFNRFTTFNTQLKIKKNTINIIGARPSEGKSALALNLFCDLSHNYKCLYFNMEMTQEEVYERMIGIVSGYKIKNIITPETEYQDSKIKEYAREVYKLNYEVVNGSKNVRSLISKIVREQKEEHLIVFIDYIGYVSNKQGQSDKDRIGEITRMLNDTTKDYDCTIFIIAQINRNGADEPTMQDLKDSGELEQSADTIILIHDENKQNTSSVKDIKLVVPKCRGGARNIFLKVRYFKESQRIEEIK